MSKKFKVLSQTIQIIQTLGCKIKLVKFFYTSAI